MNGIDSILYLDEPHLVFRDGRVTVDQKQGLSTFGPFGFPGRDSPTPVSITLGLIGSKNTVNLVLDLANKMKSVVKSGKAPAFSPPFPGLSMKSAFKCDLEVSSGSIEIIKEREIEEIRKTNGFDVKLEKAVELAKDKLQNIYEREPRPNIVLIALPKELQALTRRGWTPLGSPSRKSRCTYSNLYRAIKIEAMKRSIPTQFIRLNTLLGKGVEDSCTVAWNLAVGLYYKAGGHPWRLGGAASGTCYVGISFYVSKDDSVKSSMAQIFSHTGEGLVLRGSKVVETGSNRRPRLRRNDAESLMIEILRTYRRQMGSPPSRVVLHKSSRFSKEELEGFKQPLDDINRYDFLTIQKSIIRLFRLGSHPPIRGIAFNTGDDRTHLYTTGYVPFQKLYWGPSTPRPISILEHHGDTPRTQICKEILGLTKMNWNTAAFCSDFPITLVFSGKVGRLLGEMGDEQVPESRYLYYM